MRICDLDFLNWAKPNANFCWNVLNREANIDDRCKCKLRGERPSADPDPGCGRAGVCCACKALRALTGCCSDPFVVTDGCKVLPHSLCLCQVQ